MKVNELMIGDLVMLNGSYYQIEEISQKGWVHITTNGVRVSMTTDYLMEVIQPIPLTPKILEKNGFFLVNEEDKSYRWEYAEGVFINADFKTEEPWVHVSNRCYYATPYCEYVHQLQHAMQLCGIFMNLIIE